MNLRPYQQSAIDALFRWWEQGRQGEDPLICLPTASGKTVIFCALIQMLLREYPGVSVLILAHRKELITQAEQKLLAVWPRAPVGVYAAGLGRRELNRVTIASRDTIAPVIDAIGQFTFVIVDEAHRMSVKDEGRYRQLIGKLRQQYEHLVVIGFTATPFRLGQGRIYGPGKPFADLAYHVGMLKLIEQGYLSPLTSLSPASGAIDTAGVRTTAGDYNERELEQRATSSGVIEAAVKEWIETAYTQGRQASVFFCVSILHAGLVAEAIARLGVEVAVVTGQTPDAERDRILEQFNNGAFPALCNVGVLTEGWDAPRVDCIVLLRPTKSAGLYVQMCGRGLRLFPGKENCLVMDFGGNIGRLGPVDQADEPEPKKRQTKATAAQETPYKRCGVWDQEEQTFSGGCGHKNPTAATECEACGQPFIRHEAEAKRGGVISTERAIETFPVEGVSWRVASSQRSGNTYLRIAYHCGLFERFYRNLMVGYPGYAGERAQREWMSLTTLGTTPESPEEAAWLLDAGQENLRPVAAITVDVASRWKDILRTDYADTNTLAA